MDVKKLALLVGALVIAVITAVMAKNMFAGAGSQQAAAATVPVGPKVLVAKKALPVGTIIDADSFTFQPWPKELMQSAYYLESQPDGDPRKLLGTVVRYQITAGHPGTRGSLGRPPDRRCRCARSPTIRRTWSGRLPPAISRSRPAPTQPTRSRCCSPWPTVRSTAIRPFRPAETCRASSAAPCPLRAATKRHRP